MTLRFSVFKWAGGFQHWIWTTSSLSSIQCVLESSKWAFETKNEIDNIKPKLILNCHVAPFDEKYENLSRTIELINIWVYDSIKFIYNEAFDV